MKSKNLQILVERLEKENARHRKHIDKIYNMPEKERNENLDMLQIHKDYIDYHMSMINFVKRLDREIQEGKHE